MNETMNKGFRACIWVLGVLSLVVLAFAAGFVSGKHLVAVSPAVEQAYEFEDEPVPATATPLPAEPTDETDDSPTVEPTAEVEQTPAAGSLDDAFDLYREVWRLVDQDFYGDLPTAEDRVYGAIRGSLQLLDDDYTAFIEPDMAEISRSDMSGSFEGIGAVVGMNDANQVEIVRPMEGQPAEEAGLLAGDVILAVDGRSLEGMGIYDAIALIRGPSGTSVVITVQRAGLDPFDVEIERAHIPLPTLEYEMLPGNVAYVHLYEFNGQAAEQLRDALDELLDEEPVGLILDLRDNPGGYLSQAVAVADEILPEGVVLYERGQGSEQVFESTNSGLADDIPLAVLVNSGSASASEIVAGAVQDRDRGVLVGETTFGKGSVQMVYELSNGAELRVTVARWFTPGEQPLHNHGLEPNIPVTLTEEDAQNEIDPQLDRALEYLLQGQ